MAKLSARGRKELVRLTKEINNPSESLLWERRTIALMSDGNILEKRDIQFLPNEYHPKGEKHTWGWKNKGKAREGMTVEEFSKLYMDKGYSPSLKDS